MAGYRKSIWTVMLFAVAAVLPAATNTAPSGKTDIQPAPGKQAPPAVANKRVLPAAGGTELDALRKRVQQLEARLAWLIREHQALKYRAATRDYVWQTAAGLVNRALGKGTTDAARVPVAAESGGARLVNIIAGPDTPAGAVVGTNGVRVAVAAIGGKGAARGYLYVYALPVGDMIMRTNYLIHADDNVPVIGTLAQTHFVWKGGDVQGTRLAAGGYKIFVRIIFHTADGKLSGHAMRFWGDNSTTAYILRLMAAGS